MTVFSNKPITQGLLSALWGRENIIQRVQGTQALASGADAFVVNAAGPAFQIDAGSTGPIIHDADAIVDQATVFFIRRFTDTTNRESSAFGIVQSASGANDDERFGAHAPWSDGNFYFDAMGTGAGERVTWTGYPGKDTDVIEHVCMHGGPRGGAIWFNGENVASDTTARPTRSTDNTNKNFYVSDGNFIGVGGTGNSDDVEYNLFLLWNRQLSDGEIVSLFANPYQVFKGKRRFYPINEALPELAIVERYPKAGV